MSKLPTVLEGIVAGRRGHLPEIRARLAHVSVESLPRSTRSLYQALQGRGRGEAAPAFIMECKSSSPSLGLIRSHYEPGAIARVYSRYASGISVLCEPDRFGGDYDHLATVAASTHLPVLCKDFIIDEVQIHAARYFGADAILLMLSILSDAEYRALAAVAERYDLDILTEVIDESEVARAVDLGANIIGINHRNLHDLSIDLSRSARLAALLPADAVVVSESGIRDNETVRSLAAHSNAFLVGSQLTSQPDIDLAARRLVFGENKVCGLTSTTAAQTARAVGAVYGGLIFEESSPRNVSRETAREIISHEPGLVYVAVSRRTSGYAELIQDGIGVVQVHAPYQGSTEAEITLIDAVTAEVPDTVQVWRAVSMTGEHDGAALAAALIHGDAVDGIVLDAGDGGTGTSFDWGEIPDVVRQHSFLAGGLTLDNLESALAVDCYGLDLNSGLEYPGQPGRKDAGALQRAFNIIRRYAPAKETP
ncbi:Tryptophan biosynthesis protein TrpCF [Corynebacterium atrinae]|nr:Tryptophan biosynthesis protein TrpCF [Corynebacterium atrinae]